MKSCTYCGRENEEQSVFCRECGTPFVTPENEAAQPPVIIDKSLAAGRATIILAAYLVTQLVTGFIVGLTALIIATGNGEDLRDPDELAQLTQTIFGPAAIVAFAAGGAVMFVMSLFLVRQDLRNNSSIGAAWVVGSFKSVAQGFVTGILTGMFYFAVAIAFGPRDPEATVGPLTQMAITPGISQILWLVGVLMLAPPIEELLFRGVCYGGYRKSFGPYWAAVITTVIFLLLHIPELIHFWPAMLGIAALGLAALAMRLRFAAIGPAIALHFGYNAVNAVWALFVTASG